MSSLQRASLNVYRPSSPIHVLYARLDSNEALQCNSTAAEMIMKLDGQPSFDKTLKFPILGRKNRTRETPWIFHKVRQRERKHSVFRATVLFLKLLEPHVVFILYNKSDREPRGNLIDVTSTCM